MTLTKNSKISWGSLNKNIITLWHNFMTSLTIKLWKKHVANRFLPSQNHNIIGYETNLKKVLVCECVWVCVCVCIVYMVKLPLPTKQWKYGYIWTCTAGSLLLHKIIMNDHPGKKHYYSLFCSLAISIKKTYFTWLRKRLYSSRLTFDNLTKLTTILRTKKNQCNSFR